MPTMQDRLKELIREAELKGRQMVRSELATYCGIKRASVTGWTSGQSKSMKPANLVAVADFFGVEIRWLAIGKGQRSALARAPETFRDTSMIDDMRFTSQERDQIARHIRARINHHDISPTRLASLLKISANDALHFTENGTESLPALKRLLDALPQIDGRSESMDYIVWGLSRFAVPVDGPAAEHIEAARQRTRKAPTK